MEPSRPLQGPVLEAALVEIAKLIEAKVAEMGWDAPATLWSIHDVELDESVVAEMTDGLDTEAAFALGYGVRFEQVLDGHPFEALFDVTVEAIGVVLACESWMYSEADLERVRNGEDLPPPSERPDRRECRIVFALLKDGTHAEVFQYRGGGQVVFHTGEETESDGRLLWAMRRVLRMKSGALVRDSMTVAQIRARARLAALVTRILVVEEALARDGIRSSAGAREERLALLAASLDGGVESGFESLFVAAHGLDEPDWTQAHGSALRHQGPQPRLHLSAWSDGEMYARRLDEVLPQLADVQELLRQVTGAQWALFKPHIAAVISDSDDSAS